MKESKTRTDFDGWTKRWVIGVADCADYVERLGGPSELERWE